MSDEEISLELPPAYLTEMEAPQPLPPDEPDPPHGPDDGRPKKDVAGKLWPITDAEWLDLQELQRKAVSARAPVPETITSRQFIQQLASMGQITWDEALSFQASGVVPKVFADAFSLIDNSTARAQAQYIFVAATTFDRHNPVTLQLQPILGKSDLQMDDIWTAAYKL